jgi:hypothetical protein
MMYYVLLRLSSLVYVYIIGQNIICDVSVMVSAPKFHYHTQWLAYIIQYDPLSCQLDLMSPIIPFELLYCGM